jgi:hypothetical protein
MKFKVGDKLIKTADKDTKELVNPPYEVLAVQDRYGEQYVFLNTPPYTTWFPAFWFTKYNETKFVLSPAQSEKALVWMNKQYSKRKTKDCSGFQFGYVFHPTMLGDCVKIIDSVNNEEIDISEDI